MSERLLKILLSELVTVRLKCRRPHCGGIVELSVAKMGERYARSKSPDCPLCGATFQGLHCGENSELAKLADAIAALKRHAEQNNEGVQVEFVLAVDDEKGEPKGKPEGG